MARKKEERIQADKDKTKVLIVDDHPIIRQGLSELINHEPDLIVCGHAEDAPEALGKIKESEPDMVIVDISLKETSGMELTKDIKAQYPLREARVDVVEVPGQPGVYKAVCFLKPHYQLDELTVSLRLVANLPPPAQG